MSTLTTARAAAKHRRKSTRELYAEIGRLERENETFACKYTDLAARFLAQQDQLDQAGIDLSGAREDNQIAGACITDLEREIAGLEEQNRELTVRVANLDPFRFPTIGGRDVAPGDESTQPIDVRTLRAEHAEPWRSPVVHLNQAPFARRPTPADVDPLSLSARFMAGETRVTVTGGPFAKASA